MQAPESKARSSEGVTLGFLRHRGNLSLIALEFIRELVVRRAGSDIFIGIKT